MVKSTGSSGFKSPHDKKKNKIQANTRLQGLWSRQWHLLWKSDLSATQRTCARQKQKAHSTEESSALHVGLPLTPFHTRNKYLRLNRSQEICSGTPCLCAAPITSTLNTVTLYLADLPVVCAARAVPGPGLSCSSSLGTWGGTPFRLQRRNSTPSPTDSSSPARRETVRCLCFASL